MSTPSDDYRDDFEDPSIVSDPSQLQAQPNP